MSKEWTQMNFGVTELKGGYTVQEGPTALTIELCSQVHSNE